MKLKTIGKSFATIALAISAFSCQNKEINTSVSECISEISVDCDYNAMRARVNATVSEGRKWAVKYWKSEDNETESRQTRFHEASDNSILLLFLKDDTKYSYRIVVDGIGSSDISQFKTIERPAEVRDFQVTERIEGDWIDGYLLQADNSAPSYVTFCDYNGKVVWYHSYGKNTNFANYNPKTGLMAVFGKSTSGAERHVMVSDLNGNIVLDKKEGADFVDAIHHDVRMTNDKTVLILSKLPKNYNGIDYYGERLTEIDLNGNVLFRWDTFNDFNPEVTPYINYNPAVQDYLHANSVEKDSNGDYYMTLNWLTEILKIDGKTGKLVYRFGENGNVSLSGEVPEIYHSVLDYTKPLQENSAVHTAIALEPDRILCLANGKIDYISKAVIVKFNPDTKQAKYEMAVDFDPRFYTSDRSNVQVISEDRIMLSSAPESKTIFANIKGETLRVITRQSVSPRAFWYKPEEFEF